MPTYDGYIGFEPQVLDLGDCLWGRDAPFEVTFVNDSAEPVSIVELVSSCDCAMVSEEYTRESVPPGALLLIPGTLDVGISPGLESRTITAITKAGQRREVVLRVNVISTFALDPDTVDFGMIREPVTRKVRFKSTGAHLVGDPVADSEWVTVDTDHAVDGAEISITADPNKMLPGANWSRIALTTDDVHVSTYALVVRATLAGR